MEAYRPAYGAYGCGCNARCPCMYGRLFGAPDSRAEAIKGAYKWAGGGVAEKLVAMSDRLGADAYDVANLINFESGGNPKAKNAISDATGLIQFIPSCLTDDTLALTPSGWKSCYDLTIGDPIITFNAEHQCLELDTITDLYIGTSNDCWRMSNTQFDFVATGNHRWYCKYRDRIEVRTTEKLSKVSSLYKIIRAAPLRPIAHDPSSNEMWELVGVVIGDGTVSQKRQSVRIYQSPTANADVCDRIDALVRHEGLIARRYLSADGMLRWDFISSSAKRILWHLENTKLKRVKKSRLFNLNQEQLGALRRGMILTDGSVSAKGYELFSQTERKVMDDFQIVNLLQGTVCNVRFWQRGGKQKFPNGKVYNVRDRYYTSVKKHPPLTEARPIRMTYEKIEEPCTVWCPTTRNQTWIAKRGGFVTVTGNTAKRMGTSTGAIYQMSALQQLDLVEQYFAPYRGKLNTVQGVFMAVFYPKAMSWSLDTAFPESVQKANPGIKVVGDYIRLATRRAKLPGSNERIGAAVEAIASYNPVISDAGAARVGGVAARAARRPWLAIGAGTMAVVALVALLARNRTAVPLTPGA